MKRVLPDTIAFDNLLTKPASIPALARNAIATADEVLLCQVSLIELSSHVRTGQIQLSEPFSLFYQTARELGINLIATQWNALDYMTTFEMQLIERVWTRTENGVTSTGVKRELHKDPSDRLLIAHAITMDIPIVSPDTLFPFYKPLGLSVIWK